MSVRPAVGPPTAIEQTNLGHSTIHDKVGCIDKAALVAGKEDNSLGLFNSFTEPSSGKMYFSSAALRLVVAQPVLEQWRAFYCGTISWRREIRK
jgi:hypothetical protein